MARTTPVHSGYTVVNGSGTGANGDRIDVWVEYKLGTVNTSNNTTPFTAYFYAALNPNYTSSTYNATSGLNSTFTVNGASGTVVSNGPFDFRSSDNLNLLGSYSGNIDNSKKSVNIVGNFTTTSTFISGGSISTTVDLPTVQSGLVYIDNGTSLDAYQVFIDNGSSWDQYIPYIDNGSGWDSCG